MRLLQRIVVLLFAVVVLAFTGVTVYNRIIVDNTAPVITCDSDIIDVSVKDPQSALLQGVSATDNRDGDLTGSIIIKGVSDLVDENSALVTYVVFDSADNTGTLTRTVRYTDYESPHFVLNEPLNFRMAAKVTILDKLSAVDSNGDDISSNISVVAQDVDTSVPGTYSVTVRLTSKTGHTESLVLPVLVNNASAGKQHLQLDTYLLYLKQGELFNAYKHIEYIKSGSGADIAAVDCTISGDDVDTNTPGTYYVQYQYENYIAYLTVVVK